MKKKKFNKNIDIIRLPITKIQKLKLKHKNMLIIVGVLLILFIGLLCIPKDNKKVLDEKDNNKTNNISNEGTKKEEVNIVDINSKTRPFAVMINNVAVARPLQSGLQDAFMVYEIIVEGGITRFLALFQDTNTERIGSIRSARHYYLDYALENDAIYVHHGTSPQAQNDFSLVDRIEVSTYGKSKTGWRDDTLDVASEHTLFTSIELLQNGMKNKRADRNKDYLLDYSSEDVKISEMEGSVKADSVKIQYSNAIKTSYKYNEEEQVYYRYVNDKKHIDYVTKNQYTVKNIITYQVKNYTLDDSENKGRQGLENIGSGEGYYISNGYAIKINWKKECRECQTQYTYKNGDEIKVNDGNTFIQIQPVSKDLVIE